MQGLCGPVFCGLLPMQHHLPLYALIIKLGKIDDMI
jgi:hypothetical protein